MSVTGIIQFSVVTAEVTLNHKSVQIAYKQTCFGYVGEAHCMSSGELL